MVDSLASSYHWTKDYILDQIFLDEAFYYMESIQRRELTGALMQLSIVENPHRKKPEVLRKSLEQELKKLNKERIIKPEDVLPEEGAFDKVRKLLGTPKKKK